MFKSTGRTLSLLLALSLSAPLLLSCSETQSETMTEGPVSPATEEVDADQTEETPEITRENTPDSLPDDLDYDGTTFTIYYSNLYNWAPFIEGGEELNGEIVNDSVINCNQSVAERLNFDLQFYAENAGDYSTINTLIGKLIMANDSSYDVLIGEQYGMVSTAVKGYYHNLFDLPHLDFEQPWWNNTFMENLQLLPDNRVFLTGDFNLSMLRQLFVQYYNKTIYGNLYGNPDDLYHTVLDGKWTIDKMSELISGAYIDLNGDGKTDAEDQLGFVAYMTGYTVDPFMYCGDFDFASRGEDGRMIIDMNQERAVDLTEKVVNLFRQKGSYTVSYDPFIKGNALFYDNQLASAEGLRDMKDDFGFLPIPKLDEEQEEYRNLVGDWVMFCVVPITSPNAEMAGAVLEALNAQTYRTVVPAWYEVALKCKYARDMLSSDMIDLIHDSMYTSFLFAYSPRLSGAGVILRNLVGSGYNGYMTMVAKQEKSIARALNNLYDSLEKAS